MTLDCNGDKEKMDKWKTEQRDRKKSEGKGVVAVQGDSDSISSSDEEDLNDQQRTADGAAKRIKKEKVKGIMEEPLQKVEGIRKGDREREARETEGDMGTSNQ